ncbi:hypothetical protein [Nocardia concava]|uniref:hypothetical protein n=1 Tax=Nocardia concava TaxID=257281 RepID=UPI0002DF60E4|nr:hypothetical protein [Nocardia concava]
MTSIEELGIRIRELRLPHSDGATVAAHAVVQTLDPRTLAVVAFHGRDTYLIEQAIRIQHADLASITAANEVITITM